MRLAGISVPGITLTTKKVALKGMNNLKGGVQIQTFDLPANDPDGGIHLTLATTASNVSFPLLILCSHFNSV
jgi:hypothetical protein